MTITASEWAALLSEINCDIDVEDEQIAEILEYAPPDLVRSWLVAIARYQQAATTLDRYLAFGERDRLWREIEDYLPVDIRLSDGRLMRLYGDERYPVPLTYGDCPVKRPCGFVRCRMHLWRVDGGENGTRAGRPGLSALPRNKQGLTLRVLGELSGERPGTTLEPRWLESPVPPSCALDETTRPLTNEEAAKRLGRHRTLVARENKGALEHAIEIAEGMGMTSEDLLKGLRELGAGQ